SEEDLNQPQSSPRPLEGDEGHQQAALSSPKSQSIGHCGQSIGHRGQSIGHREQNIGHRGQNIGHRGQNIGHRGQNIGHRGKQILSCKSRTVGQVSGSRSSFSCDECRKEFTQRQAVHYHKIWKHSGERRGPCPYCEYKAPDATKLKLHINKVHCGFMPYKCKFCSKQFKCHSNHKEHEARHRGDRDFECDLCGMKFAIGSSLERHARNHGADRPFSCDRCGKTFKAKTHLERHVKCLHLQEKKVV
ncbi:oocyte zinc finger protein XlCOF15-like, partial [Homarus americanus]